MRVLHTSDWHLGHQLHGHSREWEHEVFLGWLADQLELLQIDVLLIAGDIFDSSNPGARVLAMWYRFLAGLVRRCPHLQVVVIGGNHDSAARLEAPNPLLEAMNITVVGGVPRKSGMVMDPEPMTIPLKNRSGEIAAWCAAMPFIRISDLPPVDNGGSRIVEGVRLMYRELLEYASAKAKPDQAIIATGHCFMTNGFLSKLSERKVLGGNQNPLPEDIFAFGPAYVALGHLHKAQKVGGCEHIRYCGAPIPLSLWEGKYKQQVLLVTFDGAILEKVEPLYTPNPVEMMTLKKAAPEEVLAQILAMDELPEDYPEEQRPFLEVSVLLREPVPDLRRNIEKAAMGKLPRLVGIKTEYTGDGKTLAERRQQTRSLGEMNPEDVFRACYQRTYQDEPDADLMDLFHELLTGVQEGEA